MLKLYYSTSLGAVYRRLHANMHKVHAEFVSAVYIEERCLLPNEAADKALLFVMRSVILSLTIVLKPI